MVHLTPQCYEALRARLMAPVSCCTTLRAVMLQSVPRMATDVAVQRWMARHWPRACSKSGETYGLAYTGCQ